MSFALVRAFPGPDPGTHAHGGAETARAASFRRWAAQTPEDSVFAVEGGRFVTHVKKLRGVDEALADLFASGRLPLGPSSTHRSTRSACAAVWRAAPSSPARQVIAVR